MQVVISAMQEIKQVEEIKNREGREVVFEINGKERPLLAGEVWNIQMTIQTCNKTQNPLLS